ncbi:MAG: serine/threonine-protein kinase, partial [Myxococcota bacterium]
MSASPEPSAAPATSDPLRHAAPAVDDVEARRARAAVESRLFSGPPQPVRVGRYRVEGRIGAGGMGVVYRAHDPELARDVAVKLMNADTAGSKDPSTARARLVREARAMARLAHPNVIHVYDVGTTDDGVFIAMELVEGHSLARWLEDETPAWREILRAYVAAGRGLAAAHAAGVIHRDFKP